MISSTTMSVPLTHTMRTILRTNPTYSICKGRYNFPNRPTAATAPPPIERALKTDLVTILSVHQTTYYSYFYNIISHTVVKNINYYDVLFLCTYNFLNRSTAATAPPPIERALKTDVVTILPVYQTIYYSFCRYNITPYHTQW